MPCKDYGEENVHAFSNERFSGSRISKNFENKRCKNLIFMLHVCE